MAHYHQTEVQFSEFVSNNIMEARTCEVEATIVPV